MTTEIYNAIFCLMHYDHTGKLYDEVMPAIFNDGIGGVTR